MVKIMNVNDGSVANVVNCDEYAPLTRNYATADIDPTSTSVSCEDNCDGATASCTQIEMVLHILKMYRF